jgi:hypothetical protein
MQCWPPNVSCRNSTKIFVYVSEDYWSKLISCSDREDMGNGFIMSRSKYDRFHIHYYPS